MARKRKEPRFYAVKRPDGTLIHQTARTDKKRAWVEFDDVAEQEGALDAWRDPETTDEAIAALRRLGYRVVEVKLVEVEK